MKSHNLDKDTRAELFDVLLENSFIGITITDEKGEIVVVNEAQSRITNIPIVESIGANMESYVESNYISQSASMPVSYTHLDVYKRQASYMLVLKRGQKRSSICPMVL